MLPNQHTLRFQTFVNLQKNCEKFVTLKQTDHAVVVSFGSADLYGLAYGLRVCMHNLYHQLFQPTQNFNLPKDSKLTIIIDQLKVSKITSLRIFISPLMERLQASGRWGHEEKVLVPTHVQGQLFLAASVWMIQCNYWWIIVYH